MIVIAGASTLPSSLPRKSSTHFVKSGVAEVAPDFARMVIEFAFGDIYSQRCTRPQKPGADRDRRACRQRQRRTATPRSTSNPLPSAGITKPEIVEVLMQIALYAGFPAALNALADCHDLLTDDNCLAGSCG